MSMRMRAVEHLHNNYQLSYEYEYEVNSLALRIRWEMSCAALDVYAKRCSLPCLLSLSRGFDFEHLSLDFVPIPIQRGSCVSVGETHSCWMACGGWWMGGER